MLDVHCHIGLYDDPLLIAQEAEQAGTITLSMTNSPAEFDLLYHKFQNFKRVRLALGLHPLEAVGHKQYYSMFQRLVYKTSFIGEIGLDFSQQGKATKDIQLESFRFVLNSIQNEVKIVSIHSRGAESTVLDILGEYNIKNGIFHWYTGSIKIAEKIVQQGHYFSINHAMTSSNKGISLIETIPKSRMLLETDGPFTKVKGRELRPIDTIHLIPILQKIWNVTNEEVVRQVRMNFEALLHPIRQAKIVKG